MRELPRFTEEELEAMRSAAKLEMKMYWSQIEPINEILLKLRLAYCVHWKKFVYSDQCLAEQHVIKVPMGKSGVTEKSVEETMASLTREQKEELYQRVKEVELSRERD